MGDITKQILAEDLANNIPEIWVQLLLEIENHLRQKGTVTW